MSLLNSIKLPAGLAKAKVLVGKHSPEILIATGVIFVVGSTVMACRQTVKAVDIVNDANNSLDTIKKAEQEGVTQDNEPYSPADAHKDRTTIYAKTGVKLLKCYGPSVIFGAAGIGMMIFSHKIMRDRNATLTVAYTNLLNSFNSYRKRIADKFGEDDERLLASGAEIEDISIVDEDGNEVETKKAAVISDDGSKHSPYARIFDESNPNWSKDPGTNLMVLRSAQKEMNQKLRSEGVVFLNDVYQRLGYPRTKDGQIVGWVYDPDHEIEGHYGDNMVDFGIYDILQKHGPEKIAFLNGYIPSIWLDFNVDGIVYDLI